jgi:hypothetical protein
LPELVARALLAGADGALHDLLGVPAGRFAAGRSRRRCGRGGPSLGADVGGGDPVSLGADVGGVSPILVQMRTGQATEEPGRAAGLETGHDVPVGAPQHRRRSSTGSSGGGPDAAARANWELTDLDFVRSGTRLGSPQRGSAPAAPAPTGGTGPAHTIPGAGPTGAAALSPTRSAVDDAPGDHSDDRWFDAGWA